MRSENNFFDPEQNEWYIIQVCIHMFMIKKKKSLTKLPE